MQASPTSSSVYGQKVVGRYTDGYRLARAIVGVGTLVKTLGIIAAVLLFFIGYAVANQTNSAGALIAVIPIAGIVWLVFWVLGVLVSAQGQLLKASIDTAVNNSPFLVDEQRAKIMSLV